MKRFTFFICYFLIMVLNSLGQKLNISDLSKLLSLDLDKSESLLFENKFEFKESWVDSSSSFFSIKIYAFGYNLDEYGKKASEFLLLSFVEDRGSPYKVWYQLSKEGWFKLRNSITTLGYKKTGTQTESDDSLTTIYKNAKWAVYFNSGKGQENDGALVYTLYMMKNFE